MQRVSKGYTIVEVMIFLAVSAILFAATISLISGKQAETQFNQKMRETRSKIQDWLNDVSTGFPGGSPDTQSCSIGVGGRPEVDNVTPGPLYKPTCIFLGKAIEFTTSGSGTDQLQTYSVFGCRLVTCTQTGDLPGDLSSATPTPQTGQGGANSVDLTETYSLEPAEVKSICSVSVCTPMPVQSTQSHLIGFYSSFNTEQNAVQNGNNDLNLVQYGYKGVGNVLNCIKLLGACGTTSPLNNYVMCLTDGRRTAEIIITSQNGTGVETNLSYVAC